MNSPYQYSINKINSVVLNRIYGNSLKKDALIEPKILRYINISFLGFDQKPHIGELIAHKDISKKLVHIFEILYLNKYLIEKIKLIDDYQADDIASMSDNNTSCFNYRTIDGSDKLSLHSLGLAIDINPLYNPYIRPDQKQNSILPSNAIQYANRSIACPFFIRKGDLCHTTFTKYGFSWGGDWNSIKDYQHFDITL